MFMKKIICVAAAALVAVMLAGSCGPEKPRLYIYNWTDYITDEVIKEFEDRYGVRVIYDMFAANEDMYAKLKIGGGRYDIVFPSGDYVAIMIREGMVQEIDKSKLPGLFEKLDTAVLNLVTFDPGFRYSVPYAMGTAGVSINTERVPGFARSWRVFEDERLQNRFTLLDDMREVMGAALKTLGYSVNSIDTTELEEAKELVLQWRRNVVKFDSDAFGKSFAAGEFWAVHGYAENVFVQLEERERAHTEFFIPEEGGPMYMDNMMILNNARNVDLAYKFINFIHEPEIYAQIMDFLELPSINIPAREHMTETPHYQIEDLMNSEFKEDLGEHLELYNRIWAEIRVGR